MPPRTSRTRSIRLPAGQARFGPGDEVILDTGQHQYAGRVFTVRSVDQAAGTYLLASADGGAGIKDVPFDMVIAPGEPLRSMVLLGPGMFVRYDGRRQYDNFKTGDIGIVTASRVNPHGELVSNVYPIGGSARYLQSVVHRHLTLVHVLDADGNVNEELVALLRGLIPEGK